MPTSSNIKGSKSAAAWMLIFVLAAAMITVSETQAPDPAGDAPPDSGTAGDPDLENEPGTAEEEDNQTGVEGGDAGPTETDGMEDGGDVMSPGQDDAEEGGDTGPAEEDGEQEGGDEPDTEEGGDESLIEEGKDVNENASAPAKEETEEGGDETPAEEEEGDNGDAMPPAETDNEEGGDEPRAEEEEDGNGDLNAPDSAEEDNEEGGDEPPPAEEEEDGNGDVNPPDAVEEDAEEGGDEPPPAEEEADGNGDANPPAAEEDTEEGEDEPPPAEVEEEADGNGNVNPPAEEDNEEGGDEPRAEEEEDGNGDLNPPDAAEEGTEEGGDEPPPAEDEEEEDGNGDASPPAEEDNEEDGDEHPPAEEDEEEHGNGDIPPPAEEGTEEDGDEPPPEEEEEDGNADETPPAPDADEDDEYEYEFPEEVEGDFEPDSNFEERLVSVDLDTRVQTREEEQRLREETESNDECMLVWQNNGEDEHDLMTNADQGLIYAPDYEANPVVVMLRMSLASLDSGSSRRLQAASSEGNNTAMEVSEHFKIAALEVTGAVSAQLLEDGFTADNVEVTVGSQGNVSLNVRFPVGAPAAVAQIVVDNMQDPDVGLENVPVTEEDGDPVSLSDLYGGIEYVSRDEFEIPPDPQLTEIHLRVVTQRDLEPWWYRDADGDRQGIVKDLIQMLNASAARPGYLKLQVMSDAKLPNNTAGLVDMLSNGNADIAIGPIMLSADDMTVTSLSSPLLTTGNILIIPKPWVAPASIKFKNIFTFLAPFTTELWIAIVACVILAGFILWLLERDAEHSDDHDLLPEDGDTENLLKSLWLSMGTYNAALVTHNPLTTLGRLFSISYALLVFVIINSYTANLASYLVTEGAVVYAVDSLEAANQDPDINICIFKDSTTSLMAKQQYPEIAYVYIDNSSQNNTLAMQEAKKKLYEGDCDGFVVEEHIGNFYLNLDDSAASEDEDTEVEETYSWCDLMQKGDRLVLPGSYGVPVNFNLPMPIQEVLEDLVESVRESSALPRLIQTYLTAGARCPVESKSNVPQLSVVDLFGVIVIFFTTAILSTIQLVWTFFIKQHFVKGAAPHRNSSSTNVVQIHSSDPAKDSLLTSIEPVGESVIGRMSLRANDDYETYGNSEVPAAGREIAVRLPREPQQSTAEILPNYTLQQRSSITSSKEFLPERNFFTSK